MPDSSDRVDKRSDSEVAKWDFKKQLENKAE